MNVIIVEGMSDKKFLEAYISYLNKIFPKRYLVIDRVKNAKGQDAIYFVLNTQKIQIKKGETKNIGILIDANNSGVQEKIDNIINPAIEKAFGVKNVIQSPNDKVSINFEGNNVNLFCYICNIDGKGELEDILHDIRKDKRAQLPICLNKFVTCIKGFNEAYPEKEYKKNLIYFYAYECISKKEGLKSDAVKSKLKSFNYFTSEHWDFEHFRLKELKQFLELFR
jgi:5S rRNA maturation endonuclease (ribonuclease M5)